MVTLSQFSKITDEINDTLRIQRAKDYCIANNKSVAK